MVPLNAVVSASAEVAGTRARNAKIRTLAELLTRLRGAEIRPAAALLAGELPGGRAGVGWSTLNALRAEPAATPGLTVLDVAATVDELRATTGTGSGQRRLDLLHALLGRATADEQRFLVRLLGGELRQGALEGVLLAAVARAADVPAEAVLRAFMLSGRLPATAEAALTGGSAALAEFRLEVGRPLRPMLASPADTLTAALGELGDCVVEHKLDGARIQLHRDREQVRVFTRTLREITGQVPELVELGLALPCTSVVLDGEALALTDSGRPRPFQETMSRFGARGPRDEVLRPHFFDCLHLDGADLVDEPLHRRLAALARVAPEHRIPGVRPGNAEDADALLNDALDAGHEGVVVKDLDSIYAAGRRGRAWRKVKPSHTLDLVVLAAEWGHGRRSGTLSNLHLGARDPAGGPPIMVGKTFKGLTDELLAWQTAEFPRHETHRDRSTVHLAPDLVVEVELDGVQVSTRYPGEVALRFARVLRYRPDKDAATADTIDAVRAMLPGASSADERVEP
ncbi:MULTISPECIES: ATP-dependent DNA ligase [unclassified Saccharopolyspora]|uniref:ATP-dependent DNA ligase n=1 Tax=unclassified Saccharopolyspora TaxID=2646250 RepID=UPI001CD1AB64|nr:MULTISPECIES: ATP-dependent DNA ligase [unclassified Saccharopolyspora]MCA1190327.1 ATP-dependent DNA ligase [Saccharopolyspora sp. 6T]MCA1195584.1 ATP-dependent DNA ligase [Saccharopolyspora sp. 6V]MCA1282569.1 ATP-dependent DNA ligase [Saccharopolyspora sp. 7B]